MTRVVIDAELRSKLHNFTEPIELCLETGEVVAKVVPEVDLSEYELWEPPPLTEEELQAIEKSNEWYTTEQVLAHLRSLEKS